MKSRYLILTIFVFVGTLLSAQYRFTEEKILPSTEVKNQQKTGTCWSYATSSLLESEFLRRKGETLDLSEMYIVRKIYEDKAENYILRQGHAAFGQGSLSHDVMFVVENFGLVPQEIYTGKKSPADIYDHSELEKALKGYLDGILKTRTFGNNWREGVASILDVYLGEEPKSFIYENVEYTPKSFADSLGIIPDEYVSITSFTHHPYYSKFILEIPDNYSNGDYYNVPLNELISIIDFALIEGYTVAWDGDVSENTFSSKNGLAILPLDPARSDLYQYPGPELEVNSELRQLNFENFKTTDDHLMHLTGITFDQTGTKYYLVKNSWGKNNPYQGYIYMSEAYLKMKTIAVMIHKNALPQPSAEKLLSSLSQY